MPELGSPGLKSYSLPGVRYVAPKTGTFTPTPITPDTQAASVLAGSAASMAGVADVISKMPELMAKAEQRGRDTATARKVHQYKMDKFDEGGAALEDFTFGADDTLSYKPQRALTPLEVQYKQAQIENVKAIGAKRAAAGTVINPADQVADDAGGDEEGDNYEGQTIYEGEVGDPSEEGQGDGPGRDVMGTKAPKLIPFNAGREQNGITSTPPSMVNPNEQLNAPPPPRPVSGTPVTPAELPMPSGPAGADQPALTDPLPPDQKGQQALMRVGQETLKRAALARQFEQASEDDTRLQEKYAPQKMPALAEIKTEPIVEAPAPAPVAPAPARAPRPAPTSKYGRNGWFYADTGERVVKGATKPGTVVHTNEGTVDAVWHPGDKRARTVIPRPSTDEKTEARKLETATIMKLGHTLAEVEAMDEPTRQEKMRQAAKLNEPASKIDTELIDRGIDPTNLSQNEKSMELAKPKRLTETERIARENSIFDKYQKKPATVALFGSGQMMGIDQIKANLDKMVKEAGGDPKRKETWDAAFENIRNKQKQRSFVFNMNKLNDRNSAVLSAEYLAAAQTLGWGDQLKLAWEKAQAGEQATPQQMKEIYEVANDYHAAAKEEFVPDMADTVESIKRHELNAHDVGIPHKAMEWYLDYEKIHVDPIGPRIPPSAATVVVDKNQRYVEPPKPVTDELKDVMQGIATGVYRGEPVPPKVMAILKAKKLKLEQQLAAEEAAKAAAAPKPAAPPAVAPSQSGSYQTINPAGPR